MSADTIETMPLDGMPEPPRAGEPETPPPPDDEAPYGRRVDGTPAAKRGRPRTTGTGRRARDEQRAAGVPAPPRKARPSERAKAASAKRAPYRDAASGMLDLSIGILAGVGKARNDPAFLADAVTVDRMKPALADQVAQLAELYPAVGAVLARAAEASPAVVLLYTVASLGAQIAVNHGRMPAGMMGTVDRDELLGARVAPPAARSAAA